MSETKIYICYSEGANEYECVNAVFDSCPEDDSVYRYPSNPPVILKKDKYKKIGECQSNVIIRHRRTGIETKVHPIKVTKKNQLNAMNLLILLVLLLVGCRGEKTALTNYYKEVKSCTEERNAFNKYVEVKAIYAAPNASVNDKPLKKNLFDLHPRGQEAFISVVGNEYKGKPDDFLKKVAFPLEYSAPQIEKSIIDESVFNATLNLDIIDKLNDNKEANRIAQFKVNVKLANPEYEFVKFSNIQNKYEVLDFGKLTHNESRNFSLNAGANVSFGATANVYDGSNLVNSKSNSQAPTIGVTYGGTNTVNEEMMLQKRVLSQYGMLMNNDCYLTLQGTPVNNLEGPLKIEFVMRPKNVKVVDCIKFDGLFKDNRPKDQANINVSVQSVIIPYQPQEIIIKLNYEYIYREVIEKFQTRYEGDDVVCFHNESTPNDTSLILVKKDDLTRKGYFVMVDTDKIRIKSDYFDLPVCFRTRDEATEFYDWIIQTKSYSIGGNMKLTNVNFDRLEEMSVNEEILK